jgi:hypothetical protein
MGKMADLFAGEVAAIPIQEWAFSGGDAARNRLSRKPSSF